MQCTPSDAAWRLGVDSAVAGARDQLSPLLLPLGLNRVPGLAALLPGLRAGGGAQGGGSSNAELLQVGH